MGRYEDSPEFLGMTGLSERIKRVAAVHDISCLGRCALTVIIPVLSAMGIQTVPLPTALLSTHTGGFENMFFEDLTSHMEEISRHWKSIGTDFDAIYSGFLGSAEQIDTLTRFLNEFSRKNDGTKTFIAIDPVMGDDGELYSTYDRELMLGMSRLCYGADLITPNLTEACFLAGEEYPQGEFGKKEALEISAYLLSKLSGMFGCGRTVITGIGAVGDSADERYVLTSAGEYGKEDKMFFHSTPLLPRAYPGTGDVFASVLVGRLLLGAEFESAVTEASDFVSCATAFSAGFRTPIRDGLVVEPCLGRLMNFGI